MRRRHRRRGRHRSGRSRGRPRAAAEASTTSPPRVRRSVLGAYRPRAVPGPGAKPDRPRRSANRRLRGRRRRSPSSETDRAYVPVPATRDVRACPTRRPLDRPRRRRQACVARRSVLRRARRAGVRVPIHRGPRRSRPGRCRARPGRTMSDDWSASFGVRLRGVAFRRTCSRVHAVCGSRAAHAPPACDAIP